MMGHMGEMMWGMGLLWLLVIVVLVLATAARCSAADSLRNCEHQELLVSGLRLAP